MCVAVGSASVIVGTTNGGAGWSITSSPATTNSLFAISCSNTVSCVAVGANGTIYATVAAPGNWNWNGSAMGATLLGISCVQQYNCVATGTDGMVYFITSPPGNQPSAIGHASTAETGYLWAISCPTLASCFAAGDYGIVVATSSGGTSWSQQSPGLFTDLNAVSCASISTCAAVGAQGNALTTTDGGSTWAPRHMQGAGFYTNMYGVSCPSASICFAVGDATYGSTDGGVTWSAQTVTVAQLRAVSCPNTTTCYAVGVAGAIAGTTNGTNWVNMSASGPPTDLLGVSCPSTSVCFAVGYNGKVYVTTNSGSSWTAQGTNTTPLNAIACTSTSICYAVGGTFIYPGAAKILATTDGGTTWTDQTPGGTNVPFTGVSCPTSTTCFAVAGTPAMAGAPYSTTNGTTWVPQALPSTSSLLGVSCPSTTVCFAAGQGGAMESTTNGGATTWQLQAPNGTPGSLNAVSCISAIACFAVGYATGEVLITSNGKSWFHNYSAATSLNAISCVPATTVCYAAGGQGVIKTTDGGANWIYTALSQATTGISCPSATVCFAVSNTGTFTKTTDGTSWSPPATTTAANLNGVSCPSSTVCFASAAGTPGRIFTTSNGGIGWALSFDVSTDMQAGNNGPFTGISCSGVTDCHASGALGLMAATSNGSTWRTENIPSTAGLTGVSCPNTATCFTSADDSTILSTNDHGGTWNVQYASIKVAYAGVSCATATACFAVGPQGVITATTSGGLAWTTPLPAGTTSRVRSISCPSASDCYAAAGNTLLVTHSGGATWAANTLGTTDQFVSISCAAVTTCFAVGWPAAIYTTTNGGTTWTSQPNSLYGSDNTLLGVSCPTATTCVAVGTQGIVMATSDGTTWGPESSTTTQHLYAVSCPTTGNCVAVGNGGSAVKRTGTTWGGGSSSTTNNLRGASCPSTTNCFAVGWSGTVIATSNSGSSWTAQSSGVTNGLVGISCARTDFCLAAGTAGTAIMTVDGSQWISVAMPVTYNLSSVAVPDTNHAWLGGAGGTILSNGTLSPTCASTSTSVSSRGVSSAKQYNLPNSDGSTWQEIDAVALRFYCNPTTNQSVLLTANADLWTANAGFNQDLGIFVSDNFAADTLVAWKESGGSAGTFSPNAAYVQTHFNMLAGHSYVFKLKWKANQPAGGATIFAGAGGPIYSPTTLIAETFPAGMTPNFVVSNKQYSLPGSDGVHWMPIDDALLSTTLKPGADATAVLGANVDLWTANSGFNQDIAIFVSVDGATTDTLVAWKESGGLAGTFSPNAAFIKATYVMTGGHMYTFKLKWKANQSAAGATIYAAAGGASLGYSPTSLFAQTIPAGPNPYTAVSNSQYSLPNSDGLNWMLIDPALNVTVTPGADTNSILGANADLWTANAGYNQDIAIFVSDNGGIDTLVAWKESGGLAGTFSPNAAFAQASYPMKSGHAYTFKLKWKANQNAPGATIFAAAGNGATGFSPTRLTVELTS